MVPLFGRRQLQSLPLKLENLGPRSLVPPPAYRVKSGEELQLQRLFFVWWEDEAEGKRSVLWLQNQVCCCWLKHVSASQMPSFHPGLKVCRRSALFKGRLLQSCQTWPFILTDVACSCHRTGTGPWTTLVILEDVLWNWGAISRRLLVLFRTLRHLKHGSSCQDTLQKEPLSPKYITARAGLLV